MPNYFANIVTFDGDEKRIKDMLLAVQNDEFGPGSISFNKIIPMPPDLDMESSDRSKAGFRAYQDFVAAYSLGRDFSKEDLLHIPGKVEDAYLRRHSGIDREINFDRDTARAKFMGLSQLKDDVDSSSYDEVFSGDVDCGNLEDVFARFNTEGHPLHRGHSLSVSDVVLTETAAFFCDTIGFKEIDFDESKAHNGLRIKASGLTVGQRLNRG